MTYKQFLRRLEKYRGEFTIVNNGGIRHRTTTLCPLQQIAIHDRTGMACIPMRVRIRVFYAADHVTKSETRRDLLRVLGLPKR